MDTEAEAEARDMICLSVWGGFDSADGLAEGVTEWLEDDGHEADPSTVQAWVDEAIAAHVVEQAKWPAETDCDRLDSTFAELEQQGVLCLQDAGFTKQDGWHAVLQAIEGGAASRFTGYCFFHRQDLERVINGGDLYLAFGSVQGDILSGKDDDDTAGIDVGRRVRDALERAGFAVRWDGTLGERIAISKLVWRRHRND